MIKRESIVLLDFLSFFFLIIEIIILLFYIIYLVMQNHAIWGCTYYGWNQWCHVMTSYCMSVSHQQNSVCFVRQNYSETKLLSAASDSQKRPDKTNKWKQKNCVYRVFETVVEIAGKIHESLICYSVWM